MKPGELNLNVINDPFLVNIKDSLSKKIWNAAKVTAPKLEASW